jgi:hypothetical protein
VVTAEWLIEPRRPDGVRAADPVSRWAALTVVERYLLPGSWSVTGPVDALADLLTPGSGAVISRGGDQVMSAAATRIERHGDRTVTVSGVSDLALLADRIVYPNPAQAITAQTVDYWTGTGPRETLILDLIDGNAGPGALSARRVPRLRLPTTAGRGGSTSVTARLDNLLTLAGQLAEAGGLTLEVAHVEDGDGPWLDLTIGVVQNRSTTVRFGPAEAGGPGRLTPDWSYAIAAPTVTRAVVAGGGTGSARVFRERADTDAESLWGRRVETVVDQRQTTTSAELNQAGDDALTAGAGPTQVSAAVLDTPDMGYRTSWRVGDLAAVELDSGITIVDIIREVTTTVTVQSGQSTETVQPTIGSPDASALTTPSQRALADALRRLAALERRQ